jgi:formylglycine-generating enzyme
MLKNFQRICFTTFCLWLVGAGAAETLPPGMARISNGMYRPFFRAAGDPKEIPVKAFALDILPVTNGDFLEFLRTHPQWRKSQVKHLFADDSYLKNWASDWDPGTNAPADTPVTFISWFAAKAYAQAKGKRLPTVAEWEYAALASPIRPDGDKDADFKRWIMAWYSTPTPAKPAHVGATPANFWGIHDLHGLVWEWVIDFNTAMVTGDARGDTGLDRQLFCGAGSQGAQDVENFPTFMRFGFRSSLKADYCVHNLGFRCAKDL